MPTKIQAPAKTWTRPELVRLGKIGDVAGNLGGTCQSFNPGGNCPGNDQGRS